MTREVGEMMKNEKEKCYIYTRVSTAMQVDGFSLEAQKTQIVKYAEALDIEIIGEYSDEGYSGKNIEGRPHFREMIEDIENKKDSVQYVMVWKLSRFGRNAADVLSTLQLMQDYGVNLICVDDRIDSSKGSGKLLISILSSVAEIERENILAQTMAGREQKAREGKWNGGYAPYGYNLENGSLVVSEPEAEQVRVIYEKYVNTTMGMGAIAEYLELNGYKKTIRKNTKSPTFSPNFVKLVLDNPVYCGLIAYGRRKNQKVEGKRNQYHIVKQEEYPTYKGEHKAIISKELWDSAQVKRKETGTKWDKTHSLDHEHLLSGILICPGCGGKLYGNVNRKKNKNHGGYYKDFFYYKCKHKISVDGYKCSYSRQIAQSKIDNAVEEIIFKLVHNPRFEEAIKLKIDEQINTEDMERELENLKKAIKNTEFSKSRLIQEIDSLDASSEHYEVMRQDYQNRLYAFYDKLALLEEKKIGIEQKISNLVEEKVKSEKVYKFLLYFDKLYENFTDIEKKTFLRTFVERVEIFPEEQKDGRLIKAIKFNFPVFYNGNEIDGISWNNEAHVECVAVLHRKKHEK